MSRSAYTLIAHDHPGSVGKILQNLLSKVEDAAEGMRSAPDLNLPTRLELLNAGSEYAYSEHSSLADKVQRTDASIQNEAALTTFQDLIKMHINKQKDVQITRFLYAASRGDTKTISLMCDHGIDPNDADYDSRTALMEAAMKGNAETVKMLLDYQANPNLVDMHGTSALYEASRNGHETTMNELLNHDAKLCMDESKAASTLCQAVSNGDILTLRRLLQAGIQVNAGDYDRRTAVHIAAAEGNVAAIKVLIEFGADLTVRDRWNNTIYIEAKRAGAGQLLDYLKTLKGPIEEEVSFEEKAPVDEKVPIEN
jgi:ankyrin repeat protein